MCSDVDWNRIRHRFGEGAGCVMTRSLTAGISGLRKFRSWPLPDCCRQRQQVQRAECENRSVAE